MDGDDASELLSYLICRASIASPPLDPSVKETTTEVALIPEIFGVLGAPGTVSRETVCVNVVGPPIPEMPVAVLSLNVTVWLYVAVSEPTFFQSAPVG
jgi:hypothetical protein